MPYIITDDCINCGVCIPECPNHAIQEGESIPYIRQGRCTECIDDHETPQCVMLCPIVGAVVKNRNRVESERVLREKRARVQAKNKVKDVFAQFKF